ncbi:MAG: hypothetical protein H0T92_10185 [Pyrinomonadaceae bacterium]|nr:hypothetical protein [Pyrinomonadaceae bacterium]
MNTARNKDQLPPQLRGNSIAVDEELISAITSEEAVAVTPQMSRIYLLLLGMIPADPGNSLQAAQEWSFLFDGEGQKEISLEQHLKEVMLGVDERELMNALNWMRDRHIIDWWNEGQSVHLTIRNVLT